MTSAIFTIAGREVSRSVRDSRFLGAFAACLILVAGSIVVNMQSYVHKARDYDTSRNSYARMLAETVPAGMMLTTTPKPVARKPVATQFIALAGEHDPDPRAVAKVEYSPWFQGELKKNPLPSLFFPADLVFVFGLVMPLFAFALVYDGLAGDTQQFAAKLILSGPVSRSSYIIGKWLGAMASILIAYVISAAVGMIVLVYFAQTSPFTMSDALASIAFFGIGVLYMCAVASLALMVSSLFRTAGSSMMCLVLVWLIGFVALPYCATSVAYVSVNPPGVASFEHRLDAVGHIPLNTFIQDRLVETAKKLGITPNEIPPDVPGLGNLPAPELPTHPLATMIRAYNEASNESDVRRAESMIAASVDQTRWDQRVESLAQWIRRLSLYGCFLNASVALANTGFTRELQLRDMGQRYLLDCAVFVQKLGYSATWIKGRSLPAPSLKEYPVDMRLREGLIDISLIALLAVLSFLITYRNFMRREIA